MLEFVDRPDCPPPAAQEVLVDVRAIGVNRADVAFRSGHYLVQPSPPCGLGIEGAGVVRAVGAGVTRFTAGQRVCILPGFLQGGAYATYATAGLFPAASLIETPGGLDDRQAAALWVSALTAWGALVELARLAPGDFALISAASSSVGLAAIEVARAVGAIPIATTRNPAKVAELLAAGATEVVVGDHSAVAGPISDITGPAGLRIAFDPIAGRFAEALVPCMGEEGIIFIYGGLSDEPTRFDRRAMIAKGISLTGYMLGQVLRRPERLERGRGFVLDHLEKGTLTPRIDRSFPLASAAEAHRYMESNAQLGKIVLTV
ncbi:zinc-dependent alcohol dehydrogenase family protein [Sphingopyxis sp.]|uniref:zinc-dependent alcohol dehydrogenase family protein n=1 Tax=Sphingopyxis sp. TaxID=1908224 RepID=UPI002FC5DB6A